MPYDSNGNYTLPAVYKATPGTTIMTEQHNTPLEDIQSAFNKAFLRDGSVPFLANVNANNFRITNIANGTNNGDAVNLSQLNGLLSNTALTGNTNSQNLTVSGTAIVPAVSDWTTYQAVGAKDADGRYVASTVGGTSAGTVRQLTYNTGLGQISAQTGDGAWHFAQPAGDYATNSALNAETSRAEAAEASANTNADGRVSKAGDTMNGTLTIDGNTGGFVAQYSPGSPAVGSFINYPGFVSIASGRGGQFYAQLQEEVGTKFLGLFSLRNSDGNWRYVGIPWNQRINDSQFGDVAYTADLPLPTSRRIEEFLVTTTDGARVNFPNGFSDSGNINITITCQRSNGRSVVASWENVDAGGFTIGMQREDTNGASQQNAPWPVAIQAIGNH
ncbi:hypothetical protein JK164_08180 [Gluconobacter kondonii]|uniref:hypothetical protein n=1 Tax=Gluconobacter kondonii TaxID=941463 RepID=UPI001B8D574D|nr:hypothetical protein [Gluconobacter kondonii]MBS1065936.1 hypothetical protein [Gluconobacter kondonii]